MGYREDFCDIWRREVTRPGADKLLEWLSTTDFFKAPASTRFHGACEEGLVMHSLNVYHALMDRFFEEGDNPESMAICGLLHDLCKANYYKTGTRNVKNEATGQWEKVPVFMVEDQFPYGHGEKSVYLIERFIRLKPAEAVAIRWHMGFSGSEASRLVGQALQQYPLAFALSVADMEATYFLESEDGV